MRALQVPSRAVILPRCPASDLTSRPHTGPPDLAHELLRDATELAPLASGSRAAALRVNAPRASRAPAGTDPRGRRPRRVRRSARMRIASD